MSNYYNEKNLGTIITYNKEDIPDWTTREDWESIERIDGKDNLLICIGDSWTWGDSLSPTLRDEKFGLSDIVYKDSNAEYEIRKLFCYGAKLSKLLDADWKNYAIPGYSNIYILEKFAQAINSEENKKYKNIYFVLCLTETGREWGWLRKQDPVPVLDNADSFLRTSEKYIVNKIIEIYGDRDLSKLIICRNFTKSYDSTKYHTSHLKPWIQVNYEQDTVNIPLEDILMAGPATQIGYMPLHSNGFENLENYIARKKDNIENLYTFLEKSKYHHKKATKHPTAESHKLWAEYLADQFNKLKNK